MKRSISFRTFTTSCFAGFLLIVQFAAAQLSNFDACRYGYASCDASRLTASEQAQVAVAAHARNFTACQYGYYGCDPSQLTTEERSQVAVAAHARNFTACQYGYYGCDPSQLTTEERSPGSSLAAHAKSPGAKQLWDELMCGERLVLWRP
ncbi:MAG: hypothetical protein ABSG08_15385 [Terriglobales bacterium]|jgi:hypothetical protein